MKYLLSLILVSYFWILANPALADVPKSVEGLTYHDVSVGDGAVVRPGNTVEILYKNFEFSPSSPDGRGKFIVEYLPTMVVAGHAAIGDWDHYAFELGIIGMRVGGTRLIYAPGLYADQDAQGNRLTRPHVVAVKVVEMNNDYYKKNGR